VVHRSGILIPADVRIHRGLPVTSPARAMLDVAVTLPRREVERLLDEAVYVRRIVTPAEIESLLCRAGRHPGAANLAAAAADPRRAAGTDSENEERLLDLVRAAGLPEPVRREYVLDFRIDFLWPECAVAVEVDAYGTHGSPARFERDRRRDARLLTERGIVVLRFTGTMIRTAPLEVIATLSRAIAMRERPAREHRRYEVEPGHPDREAPAAPP
jgi:very-short-patch-repair endonuclease